MSRRWHRASAWALAAWVGVTAAGALAQTNPELGDVGLPPAEEPEPVEAPPALPPEAPAVQSAPGAARSERLAGRLRLGLELPFFELESLTIEAAGAEGTDVSTTKFGLIPSRFGLNVGYGLAEPVVLGARLSLGHQEQERSVGDGERSDREIGWGVLPYLEYVFSKRRVRPFVLATVGVLGVTLEREGAGGVSEEQSQLLFQLGVGGGLHAFVADGLSLDPVLELTYATGSGEDAGIDFDVSGFVVAVRVGLSGWL